VQRVYYIRQTLYVNKRLHLLLISFIIAIFCCTPSNNTTTHVGSVETDTEFIVRAEYPETETSNVETFLDSTFKQKISLKDDLDIHVKLNGIHNVNIKSSDGRLEFIYLKKNSITKGFSDVKNLGDELSKNLIP
jgi:hypothetical protein